MSLRCTLPLLARPAQVPVQRSGAAGAAVQHGAPGTGSRYSAGGLARAPGPAPGGA